MAHTCVHWFRKGLRLHDNPALMAALRDCKELYPVFILDPHLHNNTCVGINRWRFLVGALKDLDCSLRRLNSRLETPAPHSEKNNDYVSCKHRDVIVCVCFLSPSGCLL